MNEPCAVHKPELRDPDPFVIDLLVNLAATALGSGIAKVGRFVLGSHHHQQGRGLSDMADELFPAIDKHLDELDSRIQQALALIQPGRKRELGGQLLLDPDALRTYFSLREQLFSLVRDVDALTADVFSGTVDEPTRTRRRPARLPREFREQLKLIEKKLRDARTAALADEALIEVSSAVKAMRRMIAYIRSLPS